MRTSALAAIARSLPPAILLYCSIAAFRSPLTVSVSIAARSATSALCCAGVTAVHVNSAATATAIRMCPCLTPHLLDDSVEGARQSAGSGPSSLRQFFIVEPVAESTHADQEARLGRHRLDLLAQVEDVGVHG